MTDPINPGDTVKLSPLGQGWAETERTKLRRGVVSHISRNGLAVVQWEGRASKEHLPREHLVRVG